MKIIKYQIYFFSMTPPVVSEERERLVLPRVLAYSGELLFTCMFWSVNVSTCKCEHIKVIEWQFSAMVLWRYDKLGGGVHIAKIANQYLHGAEKACVLRPLSIRWRWFDVQIVDRSSRSCSPNCSNSHTYTDQCPLNVTHCFEVPVQLLGNFVNQRGVSLVHSKPCASKACLFSSTVPSDTETSAFTAGVERIASICDNMIARLLLYLSGRRSSGVSNTRSSPSEARIVEACVETAILFDAAVRPWSIKEIQRLQSWIDRCYCHVWSSKTKPPLIEMQERSVNMQDLRNTMKVRTLRWKSRRGLCSESDTSSAWTTSDWSMLSLWAGTPALRAGRRARGRCGRRCLAGTSSSGNQGGTSAISTGWPRTGLAGEKKSGSGWLTCCIGRSAKGSRLLIRRSSETYVPLRSRPKCVPNATRPASLWVDWGSTSRGCTPFPLSFSIVPGARRSSSARTPRRTTSIGVTEEDSRLALATRSALPAVERSAAATSRDTSVSATRGLELPNWRLLRQDRRGEVLGRQPSPQQNLQTSLVRRRLARLRPPPPLLQPQERRRRRGRPLVAPRRKSAPGAARPSRRLTSPDISDSAPLFGRAEKRAWAFRPERLTTTTPLIAYFKYCSFFDLVICVCAWTVA